MAGINIKIIKIIKTSNNIIKSSNKLSNRILDYLQIKNVNVVQIKYIKIVVLSNIIKKWLKRDIIDKSLFNMYLFLKKLSISYS